MNEGTNGWMNLWMNWFGSWIDLSMSESVNQGRAYWYLCSLEKCQSGPLDMGSLNLLWIKVLVTINYCFHQTIFKTGTNRCRKKADTGDPKKLKKRFAVDDRNCIFADLQE